MGKQSKHIFRSESSDTLDTDKTDSIQVKSLKSLTFLKELVLILMTHSNSVWTVDCFDHLTTQRMDPIKFPGQAEAGHVHAIVGASKFRLD